jgi:Predicted hydrolases of HD superfamily
MIRKTLVEFLFESAHIQRWNDHMRPKGGFTELDKQAQKMIIAYVLARFEIEDHKAPVVWRRLIEGGLFEFLHRVRVTDIKPPVFHELMARHGAELNRWVLAELKDKVGPLGPEFFANFERYLTDPDYSALEKKILRAAHYLATDWEFQSIYRLNAHVYGVEETKARIENELEEHYDLIGVQKIGLGRKTRHLLDLLGQLRFQQRWAQSPRVPETSVMGHMLVVAMLAYFCSLEVGACETRLCNNYFAGLFHDLPEVLTRDIISPVKRSVAGLDDLIKEIEVRQVSEKLFPLLPATWHQDIKYYVEDEFANKIVADGKVEKVPAGSIGDCYNEDRYSPIDGELVRACDEYAAYIEATLSMMYGITSRHLRDGAQALYAKYKDRQVAGVDFGRLFDYFRNTQS